MLLTSLVDALRRAINPPGEELFPNANDLVLQGYLADAFGVARMNGVIPQKWVNNAGTIENPDDAADVFPVDLATIIVIYAKIQILRSRIMNIQSKFKAKAGPVEYETQNAVTHLRELLRTFEDELEEIKDALKDNKTICSKYIDVGLNRVYPGRW